MMPSFKISREKLEKSNPANLRRLARSLGLNDTVSHEVLVDSVDIVINQPGFRSQAQRDAYERAWEAFG